MQRNDDFRCSHCDSLIFDFHSMVISHEHYFCDRSCLRSHEKQFRQLAEIQRQNRREHQLMLLI